jgi:hypothetical protein
MDMAKKKELKMYTEEEIKSIRENLKKAFDIDYIPVEIKIKRLYKDKKFIPLEGDIIYTTKIKKRRYLPERTLL